MNINAENTQKEKTNEDLKKQTDYSEKANPISVSIWDKVRGSKSKLSVSGDNDAEKEEKATLRKAEEICNEDVNKPPVLEITVTYNINQPIFLKAGLHSSLSLRYTDIVDGKKVRKILTIGYGFNNSWQKFLPNLYVETQGNTGPYHIIGQKIELSDETLERILNYIFLYFDKYSNKYNLITRNCNSFVREVLREARKGRRENQDSNLDDTTDWDAMEEAYKNHSCISPATAFKRAMKSIKGNSKNTNKYFLNLGYVGFVGIKNDRVQLPTTAVRFKERATVASRMDCKRFKNEEQASKNMNKVWLEYFRKGDGKVIEAIKGTMLEIEKAQVSADDIIDKSNIKGGNEVNEYGYNKEALRKTSELCSMVADKSRKIIQVSGMRHKHLDMVALENSTLFDSVASQMADLNSDLSFISKFDVEKYDYNQLKADKTKNNKDRSRKKGSFLLNNRIPTGIFITREQRDNYDKNEVDRDTLLCADAEAQRVSSIKDKISIANLLKARNLYADFLPNGAVAAMMTDDIESYVCSLQDSFKHEGKKIFRRDGDGNYNLSVYQFGEPHREENKLYFFTKKFSNTERNTIITFIKEALKNNHKDMDANNKKSPDKIKDVEGKATNAN